MSGVPQNCALAVSDLIDLLEAGGRPFPVFFANTYCENNGEQWPSQLNYLSGDSVINQRVNLQDTKYACQLPPFPAISSDNPISNIPIEQCPLPAILSGIIPPNLNIYFETNDNVLITDRIEALGGIALDTQNTSNNLLTIAYTQSNNAKNGSSSLTWGLNSTRGGECSEKFEAGYTGTDSSSKIKTSNFSCGAPFWPSLSATLPNFSNNILGGPGESSTLKTDDGKSWLSCSNSYQIESQPSGVCSSGQLNDGTPYFNYAGNSMFVPAQENDKFKQPDALTATTTPVQYNRCECLATYGELLTVIDQTFNDATICDCVKNGAGFCTLPRATCYQGAAVGANLKYITVTEKVPWTNKVLEYCTGSRLAIAGVPVERYGNGTPACDPIVEELCQNSAELAANPAYQKLCTCILQEKRLQEQFAGLNLPVQCFAEVCNDDDPGVYKTVEMTKGCSARLCLQIVEINGSAIASQGYQKLLCNGETYSVSAVSATPSVVPTISVNPGGSGISLGLPFFIALGLIVVMIVLLVAWGIRKAILNRERRKLAQQQITSSLESAL